MARTCLPSYLFVYWTTNKIETIFVWQIQIDLYLNVAWWYPYNYNKTGLSIKSSEYNLVLCIRKFLKDYQHQNDQKWIEEFYWYLYNSQIFSLLFCFENFIVKIFNIIHWLSEGFKESLCVCAYIEYYVIGIFLECEIKIFLFFLISVFWVSKKTFHSPDI